MRRLRIGLIRMYQRASRGRPPSPGSPRGKDAGETQPAPLWTQDYQDVPTPAAADTLLDKPAGGTASPNGLLVARLDERNSTDLKYQLMDVLVAMTGRISS